ncbi:uncharacterized protein GGS22DRAFT_103590 [Annulohypoxylon maeteangense]|uniref:uncharacterized protein n=1 Tax=Annulohypoxylon maeteangense TaxID=1927788 RepID=UPI0020075EC7|nr:uncharacterized protein GGS22DRAFT_103590 [Annulohypoxylon maeteangense]KAI0879866.1 hypothetical protein GGS22DRAFT_103590 [Annulohypoxylon maeteangense]
MAVMYGKVPQHDNDDDDRNHGRSPSMSFSPALSSSPMPFIPSVESTFTPLSMDSDFYSRVGSGTGGGEDRDLAGSNSQRRECHKKADSTATIRTRVSVSIGSMVQSLSPARATGNHRNEYGLVSPDTAPSSPSSSPTPDRASPSLDSIHVLKRDLTSKFAEINQRDSKAAGSIPGVEESQIKEISRQHQQDSQHPIIVKPKPIIRTASTKSVSLRHPTPDLNTRSTSYATNIAQLEATAEKLSITSSIEDAIRDLHEEQKRNDSRRSSILAASISSIPENNEPVSFPVTKPLSTASSIFETNSAARYGGYSPAGFVMSPNPSLLSNPARMRSGSGPLSRVEPDSSNVMSRHGPGKSSVRSAKSTSKPTLTDIAEMEPTTLTPAAMDEADRLAEKPDVDETLHIPPMEDIDLTPSAEQYGTYDYWDQAVADAEAQNGNRQHGGNDRPPTPTGSTGTYEQAERAFADFDGAHCPSDVDAEESLFLPSFNGPSPDVAFLRPFDLDPSRGDNDLGNVRPIISGPIGPPTVRPKSYLDPETGNTMLYYPARVPLMLNLPQKLSKKPKLESREARRSQVSDKPAEVDRKSGVAWLPEYLPQPAFEPLGPKSESLVPTPLAGTNAEPHARPVSDGEYELQVQPRPDQGLVEDAALKSRISMLDSEKRKSKIPNLDGLPPQLRASAFFDLPSELPTIQLKDGSAMATLDSILDASAKAPVSAFTDHAFAGSLGSEVYGSDKKRKSHIKRASATDLLEPKKRSSFLHLRKPSALSKPSESQEERRNTIAGGIGTDETMRHGGDLDEAKHRLPGSLEAGATPKPTGGEEDEDQEESEEEPLYNGPPTTLLAELQIRKQQQKLRTRPAATAYPNGMHSTLLEMDTVAQIEHNARKGKKVNLAWEDPNIGPADDEDDEDTPLGLLVVAKGHGNSMVAAIAEINRPLGLMERRDMEDNEPLSRRRDRLQGREVGPMNRPSMMTLGQSLNNMNGSLRAPSPQLLVHTPEDEDIEGETLGERMRRLKAREQGDNPLPQARPVSSAFSAELLNQLGDAFKEDDGDKKAQDKRESQAKEEEETLGQRRRRLQAEREDREHGAAGALLSGGANDASKLTKRHSLADVLGTHGSKIVLTDPRAEAERAKQAEAARYRQEQDQKLAVLRSQMPSNLSTPNLNRPGGYMAGRFNDGTGGGAGHLRTSTALGGYPNQDIGGNGGIMNGRMNSGMVGAPVTYAQANSPYNVQPQAPGHMDRVERWRQSVLP